MNDTDPFLGISGEVNMKNNLEQERQHFRSSLAKARKTLKVI